jgi:acyl-CoA thioesterase I
VAALGCAPASLIGDGSGTTTRTNGLRAVALLAMIGGLAGCGTTSSSSAGPTPVAPTPVAQTTTAPVVVTLGDSVPAGSVCGCDPFPTLYARAVHAASDNLAVSGYTSSNVLAQIPAVRSQLAAADEVILMIGANDLAAAFDDGTSYADAAEAMRQNVVAAIRAIDEIRSTKVLVLGYWNVVEDGQVATDDYGSDGVQNSITATDDCNSALEAAASSTGATFISTEAAFHGTDGSKDPTGLLASDGDHPNAAGHAAIAALLPPLPK